MDEKDKQEANRKQDIHYLCNSMVALLYEGAPKKKIAASVSYEAFKTITYLSICNTLFHVNQLMGEAIGKGYTIEEVQGEIQLNLQKNWDELGRTKMGMGSFRSMKLEDIISAKDPGELIRKSAIVRKH